MSGNMIQDYWNEREGIEVLKNRYGFITYKFVPEGCLLLDHYIRPEFRRLGKGHELADAVCGIAWRKGCDMVFGQLDLDSNGIEAAQANLERYGFEVYNKTDTVLHYKMELYKWVAL